MIVRETADSFIFIDQHDHANIAGEFFEHLKKDFLPLDHLESLKFAICQHDRGWLIPDSSPIWDNKESQPYDFISYPTLLKLHFYKLGIEQVDQVNSYASLLCSMHYSSFFNYTTDEAEKTFYNRECSRQKYLYNKLKLSTDSLIKYQLKILQFCDDLSLYTCMNKPGATKAEEHYYFKKGFDNSEFFSADGETKIIASFINKNTIKFNSSPFEKNFDLKIPYKIVSKEIIKKEGLQIAFNKHVPNYYSFKVI